MERIENHTALKSVRSIQSVQWRAESETVSTTVCLVFMLHVEIQIKQYHSSDRYCRNT